MFFFKFAATLFLDSGWTTHLKTYLSNWIISKHFPKFRLKMINNWTLKFFVEHILENKKKQNPKTTKIDEGENFSIWNLGYNLLTYPPWN